MSVRSELMASADHETYEDEQHIQICIPLRQPLFIKLLRNFVISRPNFCVDTTGYICGFIVGRTGVRTGRGHSIKPIGVTSGIVGVIAAGFLVG